MAPMNSDGAAQDLRGSTAISRRALVAAGTGWMLGAGGLVLPGSMDEADAREGALGGNMGGRHGKNQRGRDKLRDKDENDRHPDPREPDRFVRNKWMNLTIVNGSSQNVEIEVQPVWDNDRTRRTEVLAPNTQLGYYFSPPEKARYDATIQGRLYDLSAVIPANGDPYVYIHNGFTGITEIAQSLNVGQEIDTDKFKVKRLPDTDSVNFEITIKDF